MENVQPMEINEQQPPVNKSILLDEVGDEQQPQWVRRRSTWMTDYEVTMID